MGLLAEAGKAKPQYDAGGLESCKFKFIEIPGEHETEPVVSTGLQTVSGNGRDTSIITDRTYILGLLTGTTSH